MVKLWILVSLALIYSFANAGPALASKANSKVKSKPAYKDVIGKDCVGARWNEPEVKDVTVLHKKFEALSREELLKYMWGEVTSSNPATVITPLLFYLSNTENKKPVRGYFQYVYYEMSKGHTPEEAMKTWPTIPVLEKSPHDTKELCKMYQVVGGEWVKP